MGTQTERGYAPEIERIFAEKQGSGLLSALKSRFCGKPTYDTDPLPNVNHQSVGDITNSTVAGVNICGNGITIVTPPADKRLLEIIEGNERLIEQQQAMLMHLAEVLSRLERRNV